MIELKLLCIVEMLITQIEFTISVRFFLSFFSRLSPLIQNIHIIFQEKIPEDMNPICPYMPKIKTDVS